MLEQPEAWPERESRPPVLGGRVWPGPLPAPQPGGGGRGQGWSGRSGLVRGGGFDVTSWAGPQAAADAGLEAELLHWSGCLCPLTPGRWGTIWGL